VRGEAGDRADERLGAAGAPSDRIAAQAYSSFESATVVTVPAEVKAERPTVVRVSGPGEGRTAFGHLQVRVEPYGNAAVVLDHVGSGTYADNVEFVVAEGGKLTVVSVQDWADDAVHVSEQHLSLGRDATLKHTVVTLGGDLVRVSPTARFAETGGDVEMLGLYFADAGQHQEHRLFVDHAKPHCRSNVMYKGALQGDGARTVWIGDVLIRAVAEATDTYELNRNLVLTDGARADSVPNLEIETGEIVGAGHASATGRFDDEQLFYLQSRGIAEDAARRLVVRGFFHEILMKIDVPEVRERLEAAIEAELEAVERGAA
jgi:Fe-S cluster assembly protein SufD